MNAPVEWAILGECPQCFNVNNMPIISTMNTTSSLVQNSLERPDGTFVANHISFEIGKEITLSIIDRKISLSTKEYIYSYNLKSKNGETSKIEVRFQPYNNEVCIIKVKWNEYTLQRHHELFKKLAEIETLPVYTETKEWGVRLIAVL